MVDQTGPDSLAPPTLRRVLTLWPLIFYGLGIIVGAGIYVAIGAVMARAGDSAPVSFLLAGVAAALTGLCYAELGSRFPEASGGVSYVRHGFGSDRLANATGIAITINNVGNTCWQMLSKDFRHDARGMRRGIRRLKHNGVTHGKCWRKLPYRHK